MDKNKISGKRYEDHLCEAGFTAGSVSRSCADQSACTKYPEIISVS
jgi:hypothetical protein